MTKFKDKWGIKHIRVFIALFTKYDLVIEQISDTQHEIWSHWMKYLFSQCTYTDNGDAVIPSHLVERWKRQMETPYSQLTQQEKQSDRNQAMKVLKRVNLDL